MFNYSDSVLVWRGAVGEIIEHLGKDEGYTNARTFLSSSHGHAGDCIEKLQNTCLCR